MQVRFWGVRGSIAVSGEAYARTGGNTTCVEVIAEGERLVLDGGTGLRALGAALGFGPTRATLLFSHLHWDHIQGVPFFAPAFHPESDLTFVGVARASGTLREALAAQMRPPTFPVGLDRLVGAKRFIDVARDVAFEVGPFRVTPLDQAHPDGVAAFRVEAAGRAMVFATDCEHGVRIDDRLTRLTEGADLLVHDAQYTSAEYRGIAGPSRLGWGHSTVDDAVEVAQRAGVGRLALFHHDPTRSDDAVDLLEAAARARFTPTTAAREGATMTL